MTRWRVTKQSGNGDKRIATEKYWESKEEAQKFVKITNNYFPGHKARVVKDSERVRKMIP